MAKSSEGRGDREHVKIDAYYIDKSRRSEETMVLFLKLFGVLLVVAFVWDIVHL